MSAEGGLPAELVMTISAEVDRPHLIETGSRVRLVVNVRRGRFTGPGLEGTVDPPSGDWLTRNADGSYELDGRLLLRTTGGEGILFEFSGVGRTTGNETHNVVAARFSAGQGAHSWLNNLQVLATGVAAGGNVTYQVFRIRAREDLP